MSANTKIEWCDHTFNPWTGCMKVSPGCDGCYAEAWSKRAGAKVGKWGHGAPRVRTSETNWKLPLKWEANAQAFQAEHGRRQRVFCASLADVFDNEVDPQWRADLFALIAATPNLDWLLLTKRIGNAWRMIVEARFELATRNERQGSAENPAWPWPNVWIGATIVNQTEADHDIPKLLQVPAAKRFLSMEPLLEDVAIWPYLKPHCERHRGPLEADGKCGVCESRGIWEGGVPLTVAEKALIHPGLDWVIAGGESGPGARPSHPDWYRSLRDQCAAADVPFLFKQWGEWAPHDRSRTDGAILATPYSLDEPIQRFGKKLAGRLLDGVEHDGFPS